MLLISNYCTMYIVHVSKAWHNFQLIFGGVGIAILFIDIVTASTIICKIDIACTLHNALLHMHNALLHIAKCTIAHAQCTFAYCSMHYCILHNALLHMGGHFIGAPS